MFRRGIASLAIAGSALLAVGVPTTMAGAATITKTDTYGVFFQLADGSVSGAAEIVKQGGVVTYKIDVFKFIVADVLCADGKTRAGLTTLRAFSNQRPSRSPRT